MPPLSALEETGRRRESDGSADRPSAKKSRRRFWSRALVLFGAVLMLISGGALVTIMVVLDKATSSIGEVQINTNDDSVVAKGQALNGAMNILLVGVDDGEAAGENRTDPARADSIMVLHVPASHDRGFIVSFPRDLWVKIPAFPQTGYKGGKDKINAAYQIGYGDEKKGGPGRAGGLELLMATINEETGLVFNAAATVNFTGFIDAVELLGGVTMFIDERVESVHYGFASDGSACYPALFDSAGLARRIKGCDAKVYERGTRRLTPEEALDYTRQREWMELGDGDYGRQRHQRQFVKALMKEAKAQGLHTNLPKALSLVSSVGSALTMWTNGEKLEDWFFTLKDIAGNDLTMIETNNGEYTRDPDIAGVWAEMLSPESKQMFAALRDKRIAEWLTEHPEWMNSDG